MGKYESPFNRKTEEYSNKLDKYYFDNDIQSTKMLIKEMEQNIESFDELSRAPIYYSLGTAYGDILEREYAEETQKKCILCLNTAIGILENSNIIKKKYLPYIDSLKMSTYVNYGNALDNIGRISSSIEWYKKALEINQNNKMAIGNISLAYAKYAYYLYDYSHRDFFNKAAYEGLEYIFQLPATADDSINANALNKFKNCMDSYDKEYVRYLKKLYYNPDFVNYKTDEENYRTWASKNILFLNPLNDLYNDNRTAYDIIHMPTMVVKKQKLFTYHGLYNQLKEEYIYLRFLFFEATQKGKEIHYADRDNLLLITNDLPLYSIRIEKMKTVFRQLYSLLDKIAYFINSYYELKIDERKVNYKSIWNAKLKEHLIGNPMLRTLYWASKEIYSKDDFSTNFMAEEIDQTRNQLEHKYIKIFSDEETYKMNKIKDYLVKYLTEQKLEIMTLFLMKLVRECIINLSLAINIEEIKKNEKGKYPSIMGQEYMDIFKV